MTNEEKRLKMAVIAGASHAMQYKKKNPYASSDEVIKQVSDEMSEILSKIDEEI